MKKIFAGNLPFSTREEELRELFEAYGTVHSVRLVMDRETGRPRGFGFVEMEPEEADQAVAGLNGSDFNGRTLRVDEAIDRRSHGPRNSW